MDKRYRHGVLPAGNLLSIDDGEYYESLIREDMDSDDVFDTYIESRRSSFYMEWFQYTEHDYE